MPKNTIGLVDKKTQKTVIMIMMVVSAGLILVGTLLGDPAVLGNLIIISVFITAIPYFLFKYSEYLWVKSLEIEFPNFIRDLADSIRSMPLPVALGVVSKAKYGNLSAEIKSMYNRMTWGTPFLRALQIFEAKTRSSRIITEAMVILKESYNSGGNMVSTLESISRDLIMLREAEQERTSMLRQHIMIMYAIFFMFMGISVMIIVVMVPMIESQSSSAGGFQRELVFSNPCPERGVFFPCGIYNGISATLGIEHTTIGAYYVALFFTSLMIQGLFVGLITGQLGENSVIAGFKHSLIMMFISIALFLFITKMGIIAF